MLQGSINLLSVDTGAHPEDLMPMKRTADHLIGDDYQWSISGAGRNQNPLTSLGLAQGSNIRVLVTAGASGIGLAIAETFAHEGARIHVCDISETILKECAAAHPDWGATLCDVSQETQVARLFEDVENQMDGLDVLVNNAGIAGPTGNIEGLSSDSWHQTINVQVFVGMWSICSSATYCNPVLFAYANSKS